MEQIKEAALYSAGKPLGQVGAAAGVSKWFARMAWHFYVVLLLLSRMSSAVEYNMDGVTYIVYSFASKETSSRESQSMIHMLFRTAEPSGLLIHGRGKRGDFVTVELVRGKLRSVKQKQFLSFYNLNFLLSNAEYFPSNPYN